MADRKKQIRKKKFVDAEVQGALIRQVMFHWLAFAGIAALLTVLLHWLSNPFAPIGTVLTGAWWTYGPVLLVLLSMLPIFVVDTIKLSSRFAGPLVRFRQVVKQIADGQTPDKIRFRKTDFWRHMADDLNRVVARIRAAENRTDSNTVENDKPVLANTGGE